MIKRTMRHNASIRVGYRGVSGTGGFYVSDSVNVESDFVLPMKLRFDAIRESHHGRVSWRRMPETSSSGLYGVVGIQRDIVVDLPGGSVLN